MPDALKSQIQFKALFEYATEGILVADNLGIIQVANPAAEKLFEYNPGELGGQKVEILIPQRHAKNHGALRDKFNEHPDARTMGIGRDLFGLTKNGREFPVEISLSPYSTESGNFTIAFIIDISVRKKNEKSIVEQKSALEALARDLEKRVKDRTMILEEALQQLEISRKELNEALLKEKELNELKSRFVSMASHEIRTPLTTILSSLSLVDKYGETDNKEKQKQHINRIKSSITNMTALLDDVLSVSKLEEGMIVIIPEALNIPNFIQGIIKEMQGAYGEMEIQYQHTGESDIVFDKKILRIILTNLITNALKFSTVTQQISVHSAITEQEILLSVEDHGIGIAEEDKTHLFDRFFRGGNALNIQGTGLGLNIVARYIELLDGTIDIESKLNEGTLFTIHLPKATGHVKKNITD